MNQGEIATVVNEISQKIADGAELTREDSARMGDAAKSSGRVEHRALFAKVKALLPAPSESTAITEADVTAAKDEARRRPTVERLAKYAALKRQYEQQAK